MDRMECFRVRLGELMAKHGHGKAACAAFVRAKTGGTYTRDTVARWLQTGLVSTRGSNHGRVVSWPALATVADIADAYGTTVGWLLGESPERLQEPFSPSGEDLVGRTGQDSRIGQIRRLLRRLRAAEEPFRVTDDEVAELAVIMGPYEARAAADDLEKLRGRRDLYVPAETIDAAMTVAEITGWTAPVLPEERARIAAELGDLAGDAIAEYEAIATRPAEETAARTAASVVLADPERRAAFEDDPAEIRDEILRLVGEVADEEARRQ